MSDGQSLEPALLQPIPAPQPFAARQAFWFLFVYIGSQMVIGGVLGLFVGVAYVLQGGDPNDAGGLAQFIAKSQGPIGVVAAVLGGLLVFWLVLRRARGPGSEALTREVGLGVGTRRGLLAGLALGALLGALYLAGTVSLWPVPPDFELGPAGQMAHDAGWRQQLWILAAMFLAPPVEEFLFRGVFYSGLARSWGVPVAALLSTGLFAGLHFQEFQTYLPAGVALFSLGGLALALRVRSGVIGPAIAAHVGYNLAMVVTLQISSSFVSP